MLIAALVLPLVGNPASTDASSTNLLHWNQTVTLGRGFWMRLACLGSNDWLGVVSCVRRGAPSWLNILQSSDACRHWRKISEVRESGRFLDNGDLLVRPDGSVLLTCRSLIKGQSYRLPVYRSTDRGHTWVAWGDIDRNEGPPGTLFRKGLWEPFLFLLPDGRVSVIYSNEKHRGYSQILSQKISGDGGKTWGTERRIVEQPGGGTLRPGMGVTAHMADGRFVLVYEIVGLGNAEVHFKISSDGVHWPAGLGTPIEGQHAAPFVLALANGTLLVTSCSQHITASTDGGKTWRATAPAWNLPFQFDWPALYEIRPGVIAAIISDSQVKLRFGALMSPARAVAGKRIPAKPNCFGDDAECTATCK